jgi:Domain of unknown function (DUF4136)
MKFKPTLIGVLLLTALCAAGQQVKTHYDRSFDFSKVKTFYVEVATKWGNPTNEAYAKQVVAKELTGKGWTQVPDDSSADVLVMIHGATQDKTSVQKFYTGTSRDNFGWAGPAGVTPTWETEYSVGTGVIDIFDNKTKKLIFRGSAEDEISQQGEKNQEKIDKGVEKIFKDFPPKAKS